MMLITTFGTYHYKNRSYGCCEKIYEWQILYYIITNSWPVSKFSGALWWQSGKRKESLKLRLWNLNSTSNSPVAPHGLSCEISANQRDAETSANINNKYFAFTF